MSEALSYKTPEVTFTVSDIRQETENVRTFILQHQSEQFTYEAGQFLTFLFPHHNNTERRSYSFSSAPVVDEHLSVTVKRIPNGHYSRHLFDKVKIGDRLKAIGPNGFFVLPENADHFSQIFFLAAGIGITPIFSLIKKALHDNVFTSVVLLYSNSTLNETAFHTELEALRSQYPTRFTIENLFSDSKDLSMARLSKWLLPQLISRHATTERDKQLFYLCGPFTYMRMAIITLEEMGYAANQVRRENFDTSKPKPQVIPPDKKPYEVSLVFNDKKHTISVQYPETILHAAKRAGLALPYSCESGQCGSCAAKCTNGKVWMSNNEVLTETELEKGIILTCVGFPVDGPVTIEIK